MVNKSKHNNQLARVDLDLLGLKHLFLSLVRLECRLPVDGGFLGWVGESLGLPLSLVLAW